MAESRAHRLPVAGNLLLAVLFPAAAIACLGWAAHAGTWWTLLAAALGFGWANHAVFALQHEAIHGLLHPRRWLNETIGTLLATLFPQSFSLHRAFHLSHHQHNRQDVEFFDGYYPEDNLLLKRAQWYGILVGEYWLRVVLAMPLWLGCPWLMRGLLRGPGHRRRLRSYGGMNMLAALASASRWRVWLEFSLTIAAQSALWRLLGLDLLGWACCYASFGVHWGALQYAIHAWSERDVRDGAWDLRAWAPLRLLLLNYPLHRAHHRDPAAPWTALPALVDAQRQRPRWLRQWLSMWRGPRPAASWPGSAPDHAAADPAARPP